MHHSNNLHKHFQSRAVQVASIGSSRVGGSSAGPPPSPPLFSLKYFIFIGFLVWLPSIAWMKPMKSFKYAPLLRKRGSVILHAPLSIAKTSFVACLQAFTCSKPIKSSGCLSPFLKSWNPVGRHWSWIFNSFFFQSALLLLCTPAPWQQFLGWSFYFSKSTSISLSRARGWGVI